MTHPLTRSQLEDFIASGVPVLNDMPAARPVQERRGLRGLISDIFYTDGFTELMVEFGAMAPIEPTGAGVMPRLGRFMDSIRLVRPANLGGLMPRRPIGA
ncbi:hypothetical protein [Yunchengibacter salinarum]|uniref:hypothetical protein n=1 Tax=Yunchengibacter salinarum TaxID=3133399 RepID=UPI0035B649B7